MDFETFRPVLTGLVGGAIALGIQAAARRALPESRDGLVVLRYPRALNILVGLLFVLFFFATVHNAIYGSKVDSYAIALLVPLVLSVAGGYLFVETSWVSVLLSDATLQHISPWRCDRMVAWGDVVGVSYSSVNNWYLLYTRSQGIVRISIMLRGADVVLEYLDLHGIELRK